ncbi:GNAT family N-acetyltransferase [Pelagibacterium mangrovi]|uniref:GNAT family N-acetyltransferase n=1 Tax=Pelagibacterium mangrovi TaxID=3119828 RepID=UPI002FCAB1A9
MAMPAVTDLDEAGTSVSPNVTPLGIHIHENLVASEQVWRALEARGVFTPYQRYDWIKAYLEAGFTTPSRIAIMVLTQAERPVALIPFEIFNRFGVRIAQVIGMPISNGDGLVFDPGSANVLTPENLRKSLEKLPADIVNFHCVSPRIGAFANPLAALGGSPAPDNFYVNELAPGDAPFIEQSLPHKRRTNIRRSQRRLEEGFGAIRLHRAETEAEVDEILAVFLDQRGKRFVQMGVENVFARPTFQRLFRSLAISGLGQSRPAMSLHALYAGDRIVATSVGTFGPDHYSQYINSTDYGDASRYSLMGVTLSLLVDALRTDGVTGLDMGLGDFDYKTDWTRRETVFDIVVPISAPGQLVAPLLRAARTAKRRIKQTPAFWRAARSVQSALTALRRGQGAKDRKAKEPTN